MWLLAALVGALAPALPPALTEEAQAGSVGRPAYGRLRGAREYMLLASGSAPDEERWLAWVIVGALVASFVAVVWVERGRLQDAPRREVLATLAVLLYVCMTTACDIFIQFFSSHGQFAFWPQVVVTLCEVGKLCICLLAAAATGARCSAGEVGATAKRMAVPALCFTYLNCMRFVALSQVHLGAYRVWRSTDILFTAVLWVMLGGNRLHANQVWGIMYVFAACVVLGFDEATQLNWFTVVVLSLALVASLGLVTNDLSFKADEVPFMVQNAILYSLTSVMGAAICIGTVPQSEVATGLSGFVFLYMSFEILMGLCVACVLKYANAVIKSMASTWLVPFELLMGYYSVGTPLTAYTCGATMLAGVGNFYYRVPGKEAANRKAVE